MIVSLFGEIAEISTDRISVETGNIGYEVFVPRPSDFSLGEKVKIFTIEILTQDDHYLVGFLTKAERKAFESLISVKGIGAKTAISALSKAEPNELFSAIENGDAAYLKKLPGIGPKAAAQIILDLKGKLIEMPTPSKLSDKYPSVNAGLRGLGFKAKEAMEVIKTLPEGLSDQDALKLALQTLAKGRKQ